MAQQILLFVDLGGVYVFAIEGALAAVSHRLDIFGVLVLSFATALGGGLFRDLLIGAIPPASISDFRFGVTAFAGGLTVFFLFAFVHAIPAPLLLVLDAAGLSLCAVAGAQKAQLYGINPFLSALLGGVTGVGGGTIRDVLLAQSPKVLHADVYAVAAIFGAAITIVAQKRGLRAGPAGLLGAVGCFSLRLVAAAHHWNLPKLA